MGAIMNRRAMDVSPGFIVFIIIALFFCGYALGALNEHDRVISKLEQCETDSQCEAVWNELKGGNKS